MLISKSAEQNTMGFRRCLFVSNMCYTLSKVVLLHLVVVSSSVSSLQQSCHDEERSALLQFKESFIINRSASYSDDAYPKILQWKLAEGRNVSCCAWDGIVCDERTGHVIGLDLSSSCLLGSINSNSSLFRLVQLQVLNLADNNFNSSRIPTSIGNFPGLMHLNLSGSSFSGQIPSQISQLANLSSLDLSCRTLTSPYPSSTSLFGNLPSSIEKLDLLNTLDLAYCDFSGLVPSSLGNLRQLIHLDLSENYFNGPVPSSLANLTQLKELHLGMNDFSGSIPSALGSLNKLEVLSLFANHFSGYIPASLGNLTHLTVLYLYSNQLTGSIPSLGNLTHLTDLILYENQLTGSIPSLENLTHLTYLYLCSNQLTGSIPSLGNLTHLTYLYLFSNQLTGPIPSLGNLTHLTYLYLFSNQLTGPIPSLENLIHLIILDLSSNQLTGPIPSLENLTHLIELNLSSNQLTGPLPNSLSNLINLELFDASDNNLTGTVEFRMVFHKLQGLTDLQLSRTNLKIFTETESTNASLLPKLEFLGLSSCNIREFPSFLQYQETLVFLDLSSNNLHEVPKWMLNTSTETLAEMDISDNFLSSIVQPSDAFPWVNLQVLVLKNNNLHGAISPLICSLTSLQFLDLSNNNMSGMLPPCLGNFSDDLLGLYLGNNSFSGFLPEIYTSTSSLTVIDVSHNQLRGQLPRSLGNCTTLEFIDLSYNKFSDVFPFWLGALPELKVLKMHRNAFYGLMEKPHQDNVEYFPELRILDLSFNSFRGKFPCQNIFSGNVMRGVTRDQSTYMKVDSSIFSNHGVGKSFEEYYSITITSKGVERYYPKILEALVAIDISSNKFEGRIPEFIGNLKGLMSFNISGPIPHGTQLISFGSSSYEGNPGLCGDPLPKKCGDPKAPGLSTSKIEENYSSSFEFDWKFVLAGLGSGLVVGVFLSDVVITKKHEWFVEIVKTIKLMIGNS
ncbi:receptor-like protein 19 [Pyrus x bretschneideri]|uniref:receptor-like protein 19 n=1 Tax=Pyrus x bretschneideri TaxID=225117 RepID=UPI00203000B2|nr:receptor-like protein 19 [Pyrus x bretschneideri]